MSDVLSHARSAAWLAIVLVLAWLVVVSPAPSRVDATGHVQRINRKPGGANTTGQVAKGKAVAPADGRPRLVLFGAIGRHNFGDILMAEVLTSNLQKRCGWDDEAPVVYADVVGQDMRRHGGRDVVGLSEVFQWKNRLDVVMVGGQTMGCSMTCALRMILGNFPRAEAKAMNESLTKDPDFRRHLANKLAYVVPKALFRNPGFFALQTVGGDTLLHARSHIESADFVSFRNPVSAGAPNGSVVAPDSVVTLSRVSPGRPELLPAALSTPKPAAGGNATTKRYLAVQFVGHCSDRNLDALGAELAAAARNNGLEIALFRAGAAAGHDSLDRYRAIQRRINEIAPQVVVHVIENLNIWAIVEVIRQAAVVVSTSLHVRITAFSYGVPRLHNHMLKISSKYRHFFDWDNGDGTLPDVAGRNMRAESPTGLRSSIVEALEPSAVAKFRDPANIARVQDLYYSTVFDAFSSKLAFGCTRELRRKPLASPPPNDTLHPYSYSQPNGDGGDHQGPSCRAQWLRGVENLEQQRIDVAKPDFEWPSDKSGQWHKDVYALSGVRGIEGLPRGHRVLFVHIGKAGGTSTKRFLVAAKISYVQVHCNAVLPEVALSRSFTQTLVVVRDPIARLSSAFDYSLQGTRQDPEQFKRLGECISPPTLDALVELYTRESKGECWSLARDLLLLHEKPGGHMQFNACWYIGGIVDKLKNVFVAQQETLEQDLKAFQVHLQSATAIEGPSALRQRQRPLNTSVGCALCAHSHHANISEASLRVLSSVLRTEYDAVNAVMAISQNKRGVSYNPPF